MMSYTISLTAQQVDALNEWIYTGSDAARVLIDDSDDPFRPMWVNVSQGDASCTITGDGTILNEIAS